jgi:hypothetical protein
MNIWDNDIILYYYYYNHLVSLNSYSDKYYYFYINNNKLTLKYDNYYHDTKFILIEVDISINISTIFYYNQKFITLDNDKIYSTCLDLLNNYYKNILIIMQKWDEIDIFDIAILDLNNYINFIEDILIHYNSYDILQNYENPILVFEDMVYNKLDTETKEIVYKRLGYLFNANKFDLI